jgi:hypothetical protein
LTFGGIIVEHLFFRQGMNRLGETNKPDLLISFTPGNNLNDFGIVRFFYHFRNLIKALDIFSQLLATMDQVKIRFMEVQFLDMRPIEQLMLLYWVQIWRNHAK